MSSTLRVAWILVLLAVARLAGAQAYIGVNQGPIPDGAGTGPASYGAPLDVRFEVAGTVGTVREVQIAFGAAHSFVGDLRVTLISPQGIEHLLFERTGATPSNAPGSPANLVGTSAYHFSDAPANANWWAAAGDADADIPSVSARTVAPGPVATAPPAVTSLNSSFLYRPANGTWILRFEDGRQGDAGSVNSATLTLSMGGSDRIVNTTGDTNDGVCDSSCSLREAIAAAAPGDLVHFGSSNANPRIIFLTSGLPLIIDKHLALVGSGAHRVTISGARRTRVFEFARTSAEMASAITLSGVRVADGLRGIESNGAALVMHRVELSQNASARVGALNLGDSTPSGSLLLHESSVIANRADAADISGGGGLVLGGPARIIRSTISGNSLRATGTLLSPAGAGISAYDSVQVIDSTIAANVARGGALAADGAAVDSMGNLWLRNSVVAANIGAGSDILAQGSVHSAGHNLIGDAGALAAVFVQPGDQSGTAANPLNPVLSPLSYHGGTVPVQVPLPGSPLLDKGKSWRPDARGVAPVDLAVPPASGGNDADIGAVELSPLTVVNLDDSGPGSLRQALLDASMPPAVTDILFDPALTVIPSTLTLTSGQLSIDRNLSIHGPDAQRLTISANRQSRVIAVQANRLASVSGLTLADGNGGGAPINGEGGVTLNAEGSHFSLVDSLVSTTAGSSFSGSAMSSRNSATLWMQGSTVANNRQGAMDGYAVVSRGTFFLRATTLSGNRQWGFLNQGSGTVLDSTLQGRPASSDLVFWNAGGTVLFTGSIIAGIGGAAFTPVESGGHNLVSWVQGWIFLTAREGDQVGTVPNPIDPRLSPLAVYSGQVPVHLPLADSPALDKGLGRIVDQRGALVSDLASVAPASGGDDSDIGAVEAQALIVSNLDDAGAGSLRQAMLEANTNGAAVDDILFAPGLIGTIGLNSKLPMPVNHLNLVGPGANLLDIRRNDAAPRFGLLDAFNPIQLGISGLTLSNGWDDGSNGGDNFGGAIDSHGAQLHLTAVQIAGNQAGVGAGISLANADGVIRDSSLALNSAGSAGGGVNFQGDNHRLRLEQTTFSGNTAGGPGSGGAVNAGALGFGFTQARVEVLSCTIANNNGVSGGGIRTASLSAQATTTTTLRNTLLSGNTGGNLVLGTLTGPGSVVSQGFNLSDTAEPLLNQSGDRTNANAALGPLADNGGGLRTHQLLPGSAAIDAGFNTGLLFDSRGQQRPRDFFNVGNTAGGDGSDIGAVELETEPPLGPDIFANGFE